jgi:hypothetical protein
MARFQEIEPSQRDRLALVSGHSHRITGIPEVDRLPIVTFLRDPVQRVLSYCQHVSEGKSPELLESFPPERFDLDEFLASGNGQLSNLHAKLLLGDRSYELPKGDAAALVEQVIDVLQNDIVAFGIVEQFDASLMLFRLKLGWKQWPIYQQLNVKDETKLLAFEPHHLDRIRELNDIDVPMYQRALAFFEQELEANAGYVQSNLKRFQRHRDLLASTVAPVSATDSAGDVVGKLSTGGWSRRVRRASIIMRTQGPQALWQETCRFFDWLRA